ncbi:hypothetical protein NQ317_003539 [Molorchus minor]|uniref:Uncharacterized protein n=1 Tax=Molorchus minor TaxID=1323400 RepID=A0ABQ9K273_9CUCU|nr:hypothetical protein NQ317_003539 [Molorchus minor]
MPSGYVACGVVVFMCIKYPVRVFIFDATHKDLENGLTMMVLLPIIAILFIRSSLAALDDTENDLYGPYPEDLPDIDDIDVHRRSSHFLRFGRGDGKTYENTDAGYEDYDEYARPTRRTEKNDHFIRFGRGKQDFLRFGRDPSRVVEASRKKKFNKRGKREVYPEEKRGAAPFLRFGRNSNFVRFGRDPVTAYSDSNTHQFDASKPKPFPDSALLHLLGQILAARQQAASAS